MQLRHFKSIILLGAALFMGGAGMRVYARINLMQAEQRLIAAVPPSPAAVRGERGAFVPADAPPERVSLPAFGMWNGLTPVDQLAERQGQQATMIWDVADAGWHKPSGWPGWNGNVVVAGHSPSLDPLTWAHSVFRQLPYLSLGDQIEVTAGRWVYVYAVSNVFALQALEASTPDGLAWLERGNSERLTLITCWPPNTAFYRVIVIAQPVTVRPK